MYWHNLVALIAAYCLFDSRTVAFTRRGIPQQIPLNNGLIVDEFDWLEIEPKRDLVYTPCYRGLLCARLDVPLNWQNTTERANERVAIAIVKVPAKVDVTDARYAGPILINPGGPGESGVQRAIEKGRSIQAIADAQGPHPDSESSSGKYFDVIGFDPRGVWHTTPRLKCFPDARIQQSWMLTQLDYGLLWDSDSAIGLEWARIESLGRSCAAGANSIIRYCNTAQTVEDMVAIVEKSKEWCEQQVAHLLNQSKDSEQHTSTGQEHAPEKKDMERLQYWGTSYGSLLGQTFATMHPDRVGRMIIDGIVDPDDYYDGMFLKNIKDSDKVMSRLAEYCFRAGPEKCPVFTGNSAEEIESWIERTVWDLKSSSVAAPSTGVGTQGPEIVTFGDLQLQAIGAMAFPFEGAERFFELLAQFARGNFSQIVSAKQSRLIPERKSGRCEKEGPYSDSCASDLYLGLLGPTQAIECMDSAGRPGRNIDKPGFQRYIGELRQQSKWFSEAWAQHRICCIGFSDMRPAWRYEGAIGGNTSHPLLIIGNTRDTATPIANAHRVSRLFDNSIVLEQDSDGHCSGASPSLCTAQVVRQYFQTGELPAAGTVCEPEYLPFLGCLRKDVDGSCRQRNAVDEALWQAVSGLA